MQNSTVTMDDIAQELGLSKSTVSRALADSSRISVETKEKVRNCAKKHGFKPNLVAKALACKKTLNIAAVMPLEATALQMMFFHECLSGIVSRAAKDGYSVLVCMTDKDDKKILEGVLSDGNVDAAVVTQLRRDDSSVSLLKKFKIPFVVIGSGAGSDVVHVDSRMAENCAEFTKICVEGLPREAKVLFVCGSLDVEANNNRLSGFLLGMESLSFSKLSYAVCTDLSDIMDEAYIKSWNLILCSDDVVCMQVLNILGAHNISVGKDIKIASFHDSVLLESFSVGISALKVDAFRLGSVSVELALKIIDGKAFETENYVDCSFQMRQSTK